ncbi:hypothetical protein BREVUG8_10139 [Brevundimonas sp. G8]|nr:hypothetical protein BREVUG8_10139 [Brevundimonas sp. G8]
MRPDRKDRASLTPKLQEPRFGDLRS